MSWDDAREIDIVSLHSDSDGGSLALADSVRWMSRLTRGQKKHLLARF